VPLCVRRPISLADLLSVRLAAPLLIAELLSAGVR
jgi:hypothetical protein